MSEQTPFAEFRVIQHVFTAEECDLLIEHGNRLPLEPADGSWPWIDQARSTTEPAWASERFVEHATRLNERQWHAGPLLMYPAFVFLRLSPGDWIPPHVDHHDDGWDEVMLMAYLADPDDYEGGELLVSRQRQPIRPPRGCVIVMPRGWQHAVAPVRSGERWTMQRLFYAPPKPYVDGSTNLIPLP